MRNILLFLSSLFSLISFVSHADINVTNFSRHDLSEWKQKSFEGHTEYLTVDLNGQVALKAISEGSASGLALERKIDLHETPFINWSWRIENQLTGLDEHSKDGDDYAARIYVVIDGGWAIWSTKALNYVWSSNQDMGAEWDNAYAGSNARMLAVRGKQAERSRWYTEKRNVYQDLIKAFGDKGSEEKNLKAYRYIDVIAIMTDTDNSGQQATAYYGDILFSEK